MMKLIKTYQGDRLIKYLHLQAEVNLLFEKLKNLKQQQLITSEYGEKNH